MPRAQPKYSNSAAFYDVDGTLIKINIVHAFAFYAARHASLAESARRTVQTALSIPVFWAADKLSRKWFNEIFYRSYEGASEDRLVVLSEELFEDVIKPNIYPRAKELIEESRRAGVRQVLASVGSGFFGSVNGASFYVRLVPHEERTFGWRRLGQWPPN